MPSEVGLVWRFVRPIAGKLSSRAHLVYIDHHYGPDKKHEWVIPICGTSAGRGRELGVEAQYRCKRCLASRQTELEAGAGEEAKVEKELELSSEV